MSVPKGDRKEGKLVVLVSLRKLCAYTIQITKNETNFPKRDRWLLTTHIVKESVRAYTHAMKANSVKVETWSDYEIRRKHQVKCRTCLEALLALIDIAYESLSLSGDRVEFWTRLVMECEAKLSSWRKADAERYKDQLKNNQ